MVLNFVDMVIGEGLGYVIQGVVAVVEQIANCVWDSR